METTQTPANMLTGAAAVAKVLPWSYSSLQAYETCPRRVHIVKIQRLIKEPMTQQTIWGNEVHKAMEHAVQGTAGLGERFAAFQPVVDKLRAIPGIIQTERAFGLTASFQPVDYWSPQAWVRGKADVTITQDTQGFLFDYKTGKVKEDPDQLNLFAAVLLAEKPHLKRARTGYIWLAANTVTPAVVEREETPIIWQGFVQRVARMVRSAETGDWPPRPSGLCKEYCPVGRARCEFCGAG